MQVDLCLCCVHRYNSFYLPFVKVNRREDPMLLCGDFLLSLSVFPLFPGTKSLMPYSHELLRRNFPELKAPCMSTHGEICGTTSMYVCTACMSSGRYWDDACINITRSVIYMDCVRWNPMILDISIFSTPLHKNYCRSPGINPYLTFQ